MSSSALMLRCGGRLATHQMVPAMSSALAYYDGYRSANLPANLLQAQRDYFGAHTFKRTDREGTFHAEWLDRRKPPKA